MAKGGDILVSGTPVSFEAGGTGVVIGSSTGANATIVLAIALPIKPRSSVAATSLNTTKADGDILRVTWSVDFNLQSKAFHTM